MDKKQKRRLTIGIPYVLVVLVVAYLVLDWYNSVPYNPLVQRSHFKEAEATHPVARAIEERLSANQTPSAGALLYSGADALSARLALIDGATETIDLQYFLMKPDKAGALFADALVRAAGRGVRVRFLLDDVFTTTSNAQLRMLASFENIEIRIFNPLSRKVPKLLNYGLDPIKSNRRMHNKSLTVDGMVAVVGGRNIADEYYDLGDDDYFADLDVLLMGDIVTETGTQFDHYWNDEFAVSIKDLLGEPSETEKAEFTADYQANLKLAIEELYADVVDTDFLERLGSADYPVYALDGFAIYDQPAKLRHSVRERLHYPLVSEIKRLITSAQTDVFALSPYFVPEDWGSEMFQSLAQDGVRVRIATNSLASTNHSYVHGGYYYRRPELLKAGVQLFEIRSDAVYALGRAHEDGSFPHLTLHTKLFVVDERYVYIGSMNFDPRSMYLNTEFGVVLDAPDLAKNLVDTYGGALSEYSYQLKLVEGDENWVFNEENPDQVFDSEPAGFFRRFVAFWAHILPFELQY